MNACKSWAPVLGRILIAVPFIIGALFKIPGTAGFTSEASMTAAVGVPFATIGVFLAFVLEVIAAIALVLGWRVRLVAVVLIPYVVLLTALFHFHFDSPVAVGFFVDHLVLIGALLYVYGFGAGKCALTKEIAPQV